MDSKITFTEENWKRHLSFSDSFLVTARDKKKCSVWYKQTFPDGNLWVCVAVYSYPAEDYISKCWKSEGFTSAEELKKELERIYGNGLKTIYAHQFIRIEGY